jgi:hypothetical protein
MRKAVVTTLVLSEGLRPSDSPTRSLARRFAGALRSRGSLATLARTVATTVRPMKQLLVTVAVLTLAPPLSFAQSVDEIVARHIAARGGRDKLKSIQTVKMTRTVATGIGNNIRVIVYKKRPQLFRLEQGPAQAGAPLTPRGVNPEAAWDVLQGKVVTRPAQLAAETLELDADFDGLLVDWREKGHQVALDGRESLPGGETYKLRVTLKSGLVRTIYLDAKTYLDRRHTGVLNLPNNRRFDVTIDFDNWRDVEGVKFPFDITEERTGKEPVITLVTYTDKVELNVPLEDGLFAPPVKQ